MRTAKYPRIEDPYDSLTGSLQAKGVESFNDGWLGSVCGPRHSRPREPGSADGPQPPGLNPTFMSPAAK
jgi:hypothetical protein